MNEITGVKIVFEKTVEEFPLIDMVKAIEKCKILQEEDDNYIVKFIYGN